MKKIKINIKKKRTKKKSKINKKKNIQIDINNNNNNDNINKKSKKKRGKEELEDSDNDSPINGKFSNKIIDNSSIKNGNSTNHSGESSDSDSSDSQSDTDTDVSIEDILNDEYSDSDSLSLNLEIDNKKKIISNKRDKSDSISIRDKSITPSSIITSNSNLLNKFGSVVKAIEDTTSSINVSVDYEKDNDSSSDSDTDEEVSHQVLSKEESRVKMNIFDKMNPDYDEMLKRQEESKKLREEKLESRKRKLQLEGDGSLDQMGLAWRNVSKNRKRMFINSAEFNPNTLLNINDNYSIKDEIKPDDSASNIDKTDNKFNTTNNNNNDNDNNDEEIDYMGFLDDEPKKEEEEVHETIDDILSESTFKKDPNEEYDEYTINYQNDDEMY